MKMERKVKAPVLLLSSERSGTNFLRRSLGKFAHIDTPVPIHFLKWLYPIAPFFGDLTDDENFERAISEVLALVTEHFSPWDHVPSRSEFYELPVEERTMMGIFHFLYSYHALSNGKDRFFCKDNHLFNFLYPLAHYYPNARFIYLYRDPRDYALSQLNRTFMTDDLYAIATLWRDEQFKCFHALAEPSLRERTYMLSYEDLLKNEEKEIDGILEHIGEEKVKGESENPGNDEQRIQEWENLDRGTMTSNFNKYKDELSNSDIALIESFCWNPMRYLGYRTEFEKRPRIPSWKLIQKHVWGRIKGRWKRSSKKGISETEMKRRKARKDLNKRFRERYF